ncbi:ABC transporter substrate-binding protein [Nocardioides panacihumi]|uniref:ABC transporter substrate-binding protein n=1 Tax=Nocardioides panacihumi TaxID=400774 RepID=A0ABN2RKC1_9ACTN
MHVSTRGRRRALAAAIPAVLALTVTACGSSDNGGSGDETSGTSGSAQLGTANKATGTPITIGVISDGKSQAVDQSDEYKGAQAAAAYANDYLGGINGHKIEVKVCEVRQDPAMATDCANQMVKAKASAVVEGTLAEADQTVAVLSPAGIPITAASGSTQAALSSPNYFSLFNGLSYFGVPAADAGNQGVKKAAMIVIAVPGAEAPARTVGTALYKNAGVDLKVTAVPPGTADMTPQITAASKDSPGLYHVFGNESFCTPAIQAIKTVDPGAKITVISQCLSAAGAKSIPGGYDGVRVVTTSDLDPANSETKLFAAVLKKYGNGAKESVISASGYSPMLGVINALNAAKISDVSAAGVISTLKTAPPTTYPLSAGAKFQCDGKQMAISPNVCSSNGILASATTDGQLKDYELLPADPQLYSLPAS